jgi:hypothetical protein
MPGETKAGASRLSGSFALLLATSAAGAGGAGAESATDVLAARCEVRSSRPRCSAASSGCLLACPVRGRLTVVVVEAEQGLANEIGPVQRDACDPDSASRGSRPEARADERRDPERIGVLT